MKQEVTELWRRIRLLEWQRINLVELAVGGALFCIFLFAAITLIGCSTISPEAAEQRPFFQAEYETQVHGRKTWLDHMLESDPGGFKINVASDYQKHPPAIVAVLPFCDHGSGNFTVDKIPVTFRDTEQQNHWAWTDSQRLRRSVAGNLAEREFEVVNPIAIDAVLKDRGVDNTKKLSAIDPAKLGRWFNADAVVYGSVDNYEAYYFGLISAYRVGISMTMVDAASGQVLLTASGSRWSVNISPALTPTDIAINSLLAITEFRDVTLARAEDEVSRELVLAIPTSDLLKTRMAKRAIERADEMDEAEAANSSHDDVRPVLHLAPRAMPLIEAGDPTQFSFAQR